MNPSSAQAILENASAWWSTAIIDIHPGDIKVRGYPIQDLIGHVRFPDMIWLMLRGDLPSRAQSELLEAALVAAVDHGPQAPSIAISRMAVTCGLPLNGAMASAINALDDVHGGAGQQCMALYEAVVTLAGDHEPNSVHVERALADYTKEHGPIVGGFGHRFHPIDPRAGRLLDLVRRAGESGTVSGRFERIGRLVEAALTARKGKAIPMNIDGATAVIFCELGFAPPLGRGLFILSRAVGILAHAWEQAGQGGRIKGPMPTTIPYHYSGVPERRLADAVQDPAIDASVSANGDPLRTSPPNGKTGSTR